MSYVTHISNAPVVRWENMKSGGKVGFDSQGNPALVESTKPHPREFVLQKLQNCPICKKVTTEMQGQSSTSSFGVPGWLLGFGAILFLLLVMRPPASQAGSYHYVT